MDKLAFIEEINEAVGCSRARMDARWHDAMEACYGHDDKPDSQDPEEEFGLPPAMRLWQYAHQRARFWMEEDPKDIACSIRENLVAAAGKTPEVIDDPQFERDLGAALDRMLSAICDTLVPKAIEEALSARVPRK